MNLLGDPTDPTTPISTGSASFEETLRTGPRLLEQHGFAPTITIEGDFGLLSTEQSSVLAAAAGEAFANLLKHGDPGRPCAISVRVTADLAELTTTNHPRAESAPTAGQGNLGLFGMRQRMAEMGGTVGAQRAGSQWQTRVLLPLAVNSQAGRPR